MADRSNFFIMQLFHEMKQRFPAIPDRVVSECIRQNFNDKQICEAILTVKNRNYSHRIFPSPHSSKMLPTSLNEGVVAVGANEISATESETESSRYDDDTCNTSGSSAMSETEDSEALKVTRKTSDGARGSMMSGVSAPGPLRTSTSSTTEESDTQWSKTNSCETYEVPSNFGPQLSQEGCGRGIGGGCCCRHAEDMDFLSQLEENGGIVNVGERVPIRRNDTGTSVMPKVENDLAIDGLGDSDFFGGVTKNARVTKFSPRSGAPSLMSVSVPGVRLPPSSHMPHLADLSAQTSNLNVSAPPHSTPVLGTDFECFNQLPEERTSREVGGPSFDPSRSHMPPTGPLSPTYKPPYTYDPNIGLGEHGFMDEPPVLPHDVEDFLFNVNCSLRTSGSHFLDGEDETTRFDLGGKGQTSTSSTVKVSTSSPVAPPLNRKHNNPQGLQPTPVFAGHSRFRGTKESPPSPGRPITPTKYPNASASPSASQLMETPLSYTSVNLTVRQPSSDPLPPIDIRSSVGDSNLTSSYYPQQAFQSELQIRIGGGAGISSGSGYGPITSSWKPQQQSGKNISPNRSSPASQMRPPNHGRLHVPTNRGTEKQHRSPLPTRREQPERPRSLYRPPSPGNVARTPQASGSLPDVSKARSFGGENERNLGVSARQTGVHHRQDPTARPSSCVPSSPPAGLPPPGPSSSGHSPKDRTRVPGTTSSPSYVDHSRSTCSDVSRCKALILHQIERKNLLEMELNREHEKLKTMQEEARVMEKDLRQRQMRQRSHATLPVIQRVHTLRQEIQGLQEECKKMTNEVDLNSDVQVPLGETDEEFYKNIYTGQRGWVLLPPPNAHSQASQIPVGEVDEEIYTGQHGWVIYTPSNVQTQGSQRTHNLNQHERESRARRRDDPVPPGMEVPGGMEGARMRGGAGEGFGLGPGAGGEGPNWTCSMCTFRNHPALDKCEQCEMPRIVLGMATGGSLVPKSPCYCHPNKDVPIRPICHLPPDLLPKSLAPPSTQQVVGSPTNLDTSPC